MDQFSDFLSSGIGIGFGLVGYIILAVSLMTIAKKRNLDNTWFAWIPILNFVLMLQIAGLEIWMVILLLIPCINFFVFIYVWWKIAESQGKPGPIALLLLIPVVNLFVPLYLAFGD